MPDAEPPSPPTTAWWHGFFDASYAEWGLGRIDAQITDAAVSFLWDHLHLQPGVRVFDQCCGTGRIALPLADRGAAILGVDITATYIDLARQRATELGLDARTDFRCGDAYMFVADPPCDAAVNWYTSFGYSAEDEQSMAMLRCAFESLRPGGFFALDYKNTPRIMRDFQRSIAITPAEGDVELVVQQNTIDFHRGLMECTCLIVGQDDSVVEREFRTRLFMPHELVRMLTAAGFVEIELFGSPAGDALTRDSPRCILVGRRPE